MFQIKYTFLILFFVFSVISVFAEKPIAFDTTNVRIEYIIDSFDNEEIDTIMPRVVLDAILQDVDSVYIARYGSCLCDCAGGDLFFYLFEKGEKKLKFHANKGIPKICNFFTDSLDLVFKLKNASRINALTDSLKNNWKKHPKKRRKKINIEVLPDSLKKTIKTKEGYYVDPDDLEKMHKFDSLLKSGKSIYELDDF